MNTITLKFSEDQAAVVNTAVNLAENTRFSFIVLLRPMIPHTPGRLLTLTVDQMTHHQRSQLPMRLPQEVRRF